LTRAAQPGTAPNAKLKPFIIHCIALDTFNGLLHSAIDINQLLLILHFYFVLLYIIIT